jgi:hypothetical protein
MLTGLLINEKFELTSIVLSIDSINGASVVRDISATSKSPDLILLKSELKGIALQVT